MRIPIRLLLVYVFANAYVLAYAVRLIWDISAAVSGDQWRFEHWAWVQLDHHITVLQGVLDETDK